MTPITLLLFTLLLMTVARAVGDSTSIPVPSLFVVLPERLTVPVTMTLIPTMDACSTVLSLMVTELMATRSSVSTPMPVLSDSIRLSCTRSPEPAVISTPAVPDELTGGSIVK